MGNILRIFLWAIIVNVFAGSLSAGETSSNSFWVHFKDKGAWELLSSEELLDAAFDFGMTNKALERRRLEGIQEENLITISDLPPDPFYVKSVSETGALCRQESRWFNLISVEANINQVEAIEALPFVEKVTHIAEMKPSGYWYEEVGTFDGNPPPGAGIDMPGMYGPSYLQALQVNAVEAHRAGYTGKGVLLVILDGGYELSHEAFQNLDVFAEWDAVYNDDYTGHEPSDKPFEAAHGTGCLSEIGGYSPGNLIGIAYEASFLLAKTEDARDETPKEEDDYLAAVEWAERLGARVLSSSLGYTDWYNTASMDGETPITSQAHNRAYEMGMVCVTSASNDGPQPRTLGAPADAWGSLTIGAVDSLGVIGKFSSRGPTADGRIKPDLVARGVKTVLVSPYSANRYSMWNGTSMSCPVVGGVVALVRGAHPEWSAERTVQALKTTADRANRPDNTYGWGMPDVMAAIRYPEVSFTLLSSDGNPMKGVDVKLTDDREEYVVSTDQNGKASFPNLAEGEWSYSASLKRGDVDVTLHSGSIVVKDGKKLVLKDSTNN